MTIRIAFILIVSMLVYSCSQTGSQTKSTIKKQFYADGKLQLEREFINDTTVHGFYREYYPNGVLKVERRYLLNLEEGIVKGYFDNGKLMYFINYDSGILEGPAEWYHQNGKIELKYHNHNGKAVGDFFEYDSLGNLLTYGSRNFEGLIKFEEKFTSEGNLISRFGDPLIDLDQIGNKFQIGDSLRIYFRLATPPKATCTLMFTVTGGTSSDTESFMIEQNSQEQFYEKKLTARGSFKIVGAYTVTYSPADKLERVFSSTYEVN